MKRLLLILAIALAGIAPTVADENPSSQDMARRSLERRAVEGVIWGMPAVNYDLMLQEMLTKTAGKVNQVIYWGRPLDWHNQTLTPNPDTARRLALVWGLEPRLGRQPDSLEQVTDDAVEAAMQYGLAGPGQRVLILAGTPFGAPGAANLLRLAHAPTKPAKRRAK